MNKRDYPDGMRAARGQRGLTLVELMISITLGLVIVGALMGVLASTSASRTSTERESELQTNGRYAIEFLRRELLHAGFRGNTWAEPGAVVGVGTVTGDCGAGFATNIRQGVWATNDANPFSATCLPSAQYSTGDIVVVRRTSFLPVAVLNATTVHFRSAYERGQVFKGAAPSFVVEVPFQDYRMDVSVFYISPFTNSAGESPLVPALYRKTLTAGPAYTTAMVASNIEDMQIQFGRYTTDERTQYFDPDGVAGTSVTTDPTDWDDVNLARIWLLVRSTSPEPGYTNTNTYDLGDKSVTVNDGFRRQVYSAVVQLRN